MPRQRRFLGFVLMLFGSVAMLALCAGHAGAVPGDISTFAGDGTAGFLGDGSAATAAQLNSPHGVFGDGAGNIYIADVNNNRIRKVDPSGDISTFAGDGTVGSGGDGGAATAAQLNGPQSVFVDGSGNVYIADVNNNRIRKVDPSGDISTFAGDGTVGSGGDGGAATAAQLNGPQSVFVDGSGNVYIADVNNNRIRKVDPSGDISTFAGDGTVGSGGDGGAATAAQLDSPLDVSVDGSGNVYIADTNNNRIRKVDSSGDISTFAGTGTAGFSGDGGPATLAQIFFPHGVSVDGSGNVYIADTANQRIRKVEGTPIPVEVSLPSVTATYNQALTIPVSISDATGIIAGEVFVEYDTDLLTLVGVSSVGTLSDGWSVESNTEAGLGTLEKVKIALATDVNAATGPATWIDINFTVNDVRLPTSSALTLSDVLLNDGTPTNVTTDGLVTLVGNDGSIGSSPALFIPRDDLTVSVTDLDADLDGLANTNQVSVTVTNLNNGDVVNATLPEDAATAGTFEVVVPTEFGTVVVVDATIQAQASDVIEFSFSDELDSNGNGPIIRTDQSTAIGGTDGTAAITQVTQPGDVIYLRVDDADLNTNPGTVEIAQVVVTSTNGETETVTLTEVDDDDDVFFGSLNSTSGAAAGTDDDGTLNAAKGDVLTATYDDVVTVLGDQLDRVDINQGVVDPFGDADGNGLIQAFDAAQVLQHILVPPLVTLTGLELLAADVADAFGVLSPFDAAFILKKVVGLITTFPVQEAASLNHPQSVPSSSPKKVVERRGLALAYADGYLSLQIDERSGIISGDVLLAGVDGEVRPAAELADFIVASRSTEEGLRIVFAGAVPVDGPGELLRVYSGVGLNKAQLARVRFNDGAIVAEVTEIATVPSRPIAFVLHANWPNPFNPETTIAFDLPQASVVELQIFDILGQSVRTLVAEGLPAGRHQVVWNGLDASGNRVSSGVYFYRLQTGQQMQMRRMLLIK